MFHNIYFNKFSRIVMMKSNAEFNYYFTKKVFREDNKLYFQILFSVFVLVTCFITIIGSFDYKQHQSSYKKIIKKRYVNLISKLLVEEPKQTGETILGDTNKDHILSPKGKRALEIKIAEEKARQSVYIPPSGTAPYGDLAEFEDLEINTDDQLIAELTSESNKSGAAVKRGIPLRRKKTKMHKYSSVYDLVSHPFEYDLSRRGVMYINVTDELLHQPQTEQAGYRDPDEISRVVATHLPMVEHCFHKARRINSNIKGYIKFEFRISYDGYVIPESIRVLKSTINDPLVEQCIKKTIRRWRDFQKLDKKMGIVRTVQKFAFN